jgi:hypothetical protein
VTDYLRGQVVQNDGSSYVCKVDHTSGAGSEPGVGGSWATYWDLLAAAGVGITDGDRGDIVVSASGTTWTVEANAVTDAKLRDSAALSVIGRSANSSGDPADIAAGTDGHVLRRSGTTLGFGTIATVGIADAAVTNAKLAPMTGPTVKGRESGSGDPADLSAGQLRGILGSGTADSSAYLRGDGVWSAISAFATASHTHAAADVTSGVFAVARLGSGTPSSGTYLRGDGQWIASSNFASSTHTHTASDITSGTIATARLGSGTADETTFLRGDGTWSTPAGGSGGEVEFGAVKRLAYLRL